MKWLNHIFPTKNQRIILSTAEQIFIDVCNGDTSAATVYRDHPATREQDWRMMKSELQSLSDTSDNNELTRRIRGKLVVVVESLVTDHWYTNLEEADRDIICRHLLESSRELQDKHYYFSLARSYAYSSILDFLLINGWVGSEESKENLKKYQKGFIEMCQAHCNFLLTIGTAKMEGRKIKESEKESGKTTVMLKEGMRRALAGEEIFDQ